MGFIQQLLAEKEKHVKRIETINTLLESYGYGAEDKVALEKVSEKKEEDIDSPNGYIKGKRYPKGAPWHKQLLFILESEDRFLHNIEFTNIILGKENVKDKVWLRRRVSAELSKAKRDNLIEGLVSVKFGRSTKDTVWGYNKWLNKDGSINPNFNFKEKSLSIKSYELF